jgi:hypothetical protein
VKNAGTQEHGVGFGALEAHIVRVPHYGASPKSFVPRLRDDIEFLLSLLCVFAPLRESFSRRDLTRTSAVVHRSSRLRALELTLEPELELSAF